MNDNTKNYAVYHLADSGMNPKEISKELELTVKEIKDILNNRSQSNSSIPTTSAKVNSKNLMITETSVKGNKSVAIMTKAASEVNDEFRKNIDNTQSRTSKNAIFRPNK